jgi:predicted ATPase
MLIHEITLRGILSFGPETPPLELRSLNLLVGPNGSGKSNLIEAIGLLRSAPSKLNAPMRGPGSGAVGDWIWKGVENGTAKIDAVLQNPIGELPPRYRTAFPLRHRIEFTEKQSRFELLDESIENAEIAPGMSEPNSYYRFQHGRPVITASVEGRREIELDGIATDESILSQRKDPDQYPQLEFLSDLYRTIRLYREWSFGRSSVFRRPQEASLPSGSLEENFSNLGLFLNHLRRKPKAKKEILNRLRDLYEGLDDFDVRVQGGTVEVFLTEGDFIIPASRLSDGTLRYLCLLAILCDPDPPSLICIEEPELGLHPDLLPKIAELLIAASERTQLIVTTHSDLLVDAMTDQPESVVVMEKHDGQTQAKRLQNDAELQGYLESYRLGEMWIRGLIGGTRW